MPTVPTTLSAQADLRALLDAIPIAGDGDVIVPEYHNTLRAAIEHVGQALDKEQPVPVVTRSFPPTLWPTLVEETMKAAGEWQSYPTHASPLDATATGWMALELPEGTDLDTLSIRGDRLGPFTVWSFGLYRLELAGATWGGAGWASVCDGVVAPRGIEPAVPLPTRPFVATEQVAGEGLTPTQTAELRRVDASRYRYVFVTSVSGAKAPSDLELQLIQVTCTRPGA